MKPALLLVLGVTDLVALNAFVVPRLLAREPAPAPPIASAPPIIASAPPAIPSERRSRDSRDLAEPAPRLAAAAARPAPSEVTPPTPSVPAPAALYFATERATIFPASAAVLDRVAAQLADEPRLTLHVTAHACAAGRDTYNLALSQRRARRVIEYLAAHDIDPARIVTVARGEQDARDDQPDAREDRRVDLRFEVTP